MSISTDALKRLAALQLAPEAMQEVIAIIISCIEPLETRRQRDRDRKRLHGNSTDNPQKILGNSSEIPLEIPPRKIPPPVSSKPKRVSRSVGIDVPELPSEDQIATAISRGWRREYALSEWQRFRDWSLNKGRTHKNLDAAWRNWVTSPYQATGTANGSRPQADRSAVAGADRVLERLRQFG